MMIDNVQVFNADCLPEMQRLASEGVLVDCVVIDPPYGISFMGKNWDHGIPGIPFWKAAYDLLPPGGHLLAFGGTRAFHRLACVIEDAGFEIRDTIMWVYGSGFPKSHDVGKALDKAAGAEREAVGAGRWAGREAEPSGTENWRLRNEKPRLETAPATAAAQQWDGWGTALKPAWEPIILARKPLDGTVAQNVLAHGVGALNIDGCRVGADGGTRAVSFGANAGTMFGAGKGKPTNEIEAINAGRWPANLAHDGSAEVEAAFAEQSERMGMHSAGKARSGKFGSEYNASSYDMSGPREMGRFGDEGTASRFFYSAKASKHDRADSKHPTVKPVELMRWLVRMVCPPGGVVLDPFAGSGTTLAAAVLEGFGAIGIEKEADYHADILRRLKGLTPEVVQRERFKTNGKAAVAKMTTGARRGRKPKFEIPEDEAEQAEFVRKLRNGELKL